MNRRGFAKNTLFGLFVGLFGRKAIAEVITEKPTASVILPRTIPTPDISRYGQRTVQEHAALREFITPKIGECPHLKNHFKNGSTRWPRPKSISKDYNLSKHTFVDGTTRIRCLSCGQKWFKDDKDFKKMVDLHDNESSNWASSSEYSPLWKLK